MSVLIDDLLNLSRASSHPLHRTLIDLSHIAGAVAARLQADNKERHVRFIIAKGARVFADDGLMQVVLDNLLGNAWKYTSKTESAEIEFGYTEEESGTVYFVRDNGAGFDMRHANKLFGVFQRLHLAEEFEGTGIGLATVQRIVHRHGGTCSAEGVVDQGATFYFTLPKA